MDPQVGSAMQYPYISNDNLRLYMSGVMYIDILERESPDAPWSPWQRLPDHINLTTHQRSPCESPSGDTLYWMSMERPEGSYGGFDIYYSVRTDTGWGPVFNCGPEVNSAYNEFAVSISRDGSLLLTASARRGTIGGDLYYHEKQADNTWGPAIRFSENINTWRSEEAVSMSPNNDRLFFYRVGPNTGDIWESRKVDGVWQPAESLPSPVNEVMTQEMDPCMAPDGRTLWYRRELEPHSYDYEIVTTVDTSIVAVNLPSSVIPECFSWSVYPNPFNSTAMIEFEAPPEVNTVDLSVWNTLGRLVSQVTLTVQASRGTHRLQAGDLPTGLYFVRAEAGGITATKKLMLLR